MHHLDGAGRGEDALRIAAQDLRHHQGQDGPQALAGGEEAVLEGGLDPGGLTRGQERLEGRVHLLAAALERRLQRPEVRGEEAASGS